MKPINIRIRDDLKARLDMEAARQRRSQRSVVEIALERYFLDLDRQKALTEADLQDDLEREVS